MKLRVIIILCLILADAIFYFCLETTRFYLDFPLGLELFLNFAEPHNYTSYILFTGGFICLFVGIATDSYLGRFKVVIFGLCFLFCSSLSLLVVTFRTTSASIQVTNLLICVVFFVIYLTTSCVRDVLLLEQIAIPEQIVFVRRYIYLIVYLRLLAAFANKCFENFSYARTDNDLKKVRLVLDTIIIFLYMTLLIFYYWVHKLYIEPIQNGIVCQSIKCLKFGATYRDSELIRRQRPTERARFSVFQRPNMTYPTYFLVFLPDAQKTQDKPPAKKRPRPEGDRKDKGDPKKTKQRKTDHDIKENPKETKKEHSTEVGKAEKKREHTEPLISQADLAEKTKSEKKPDKIKVQEQEKVEPSIISPKQQQVEEKVEETKEEKAGYWMTNWMNFNWLFAGAEDKKDTQQPKLMEEHIPGKKKLGWLREPGVDKDHRFHLTYLKDHWLYHAKSRYPLSIMEETRQFWVIKFIYGTSILFYLSSYFTLYITNLQGAICKKTDINIYFNYNHLGLCYCFFDVIFFPLFEFIVIPILRRLRICYRDLQLIGLSSILLLMALIHGFIVQIKLEQTLDYLPSSYFAQLRIYSTLNTSTTVESSEFSTGKVLRFNFRQYTNIPGSGNFQVLLAIENKENSLHLKQHVDLMAKNTVSYILTINGLIKNSEQPDPTNYFETEIKTNVGYYFIVSTINLENLKIIFVDQYKKESFSHTIGKNGEKVYIAPGEYFITILNNTNAFVLTKYHVIEDGGIYSIFVFYRDTSLRGTIVNVERPITVSFSVLLAQVVLQSLSQASGTISFYRFLFLESGPKLRCSVFSIVYMLGFFSVGILTLIIVETVSGSLYVLNLIVVVIHIAGMIVYFYSSGKFLYVYPYKH